MECILAKPGETNLDSFEELFERDFDSAVEFRLTLTTETDRGCALMAAAYLDSRLGEWLTSFFVDSPALASRVLHPDGPLGTFSSRIDTAFLLGLLAPREHRALHLIRKIRNEFGHVPKPISFDEERVANWCRNLEELGLYKRGKHRAMFTGAVMMVLAAINVRRRQTTRCEARPDIDFEKAIGREPLEILQAIAQLTASPPEAEDKAILSLQTTIAAVLSGSPEQRKVMAEKIAQGLNARLKSSDGSAEIKQ